MSYERGKQTAYSDQKNWSNDYLTDPKKGFPGVYLTGPMVKDPL